MAIELKPHNVETLKKVKEKFKESKKVAIVHPTGTGKSIIALKVIEESEGKKVIYLAPSNSILHNVKKDIFEAGMNMTHFPNLKRMTYQKLAKLSQKEIEELGADYIILDEFHHCGAEKWGEGVERLLQRNPEANILGLSATPIRYFDGLRDMSDELFDGNVASEMTLEEAIVKGILPKAKYVSALYGYEEELKNILQKIEKIKDPEKRKQAEELFDRMSKRLSEETKNLPQLLANNMTNKSGKYIVFCKNIDDMREKKEQAQKMFGQVNSNITVRSVSSDEDIKKNERMLSEFEKDSEDGSLKLLFAVNMLNEGYHIKDLDGVVMMRPTYSPTIYAQQLGRALSVGNGKEPVIIDLVNNFDSCKIIEDFAERMKQYESTGEKRKDNSKAKSRLSIFDKTQEFRNIAQKITDILSTTKVSLEDKINIFEEFLANNEEEITSTTMYEGYPIGQWAIQIRSSLKRNDNSINPTDGQLERLEELGILESQIESTIDEKIERMAEWVKKYPRVKLVNLRHVEPILRSYSSSDEEYKELLKQYQKMQDYYDYARVRKSKDKLTDDQLEKIKEANIGGVFGYSKNIEEIAKKHGYDEEDVIYLLNTYGSIENFHRLYLKGEIKDQSDFDLVSSKVRTVIDIDGNPNSEGYERLVKILTGIDDHNTGIIIYSREAIDKKISGLTPREKIVLERRFNLKDEGLPMDLENLSKELRVTRERIRQIEAKALRKMKNRIYYNSDMNYYFDTRIHNNRFYLFNGLQELMTEDEKKEFSQIEDDLIDVCFKNKNSEDADVKRELHFLKKVIEEHRERYNKKQQENEKMEIEETRQKIIDGTISMKELGFSDKIIETLNDSGIKSIFEFSNDTPGEIKEKTGLDYSEIKQIMEKMSLYSLYNKKPKEVFELKIDELDLSERSNNALVRAGFNTLGDILVKPCLEVYNYLSCDEDMKKITPYSALVKDIIKEKEKEEIGRDILEESNLDEITIEELDLSRRTFNILARGGYANLLELVKLTKTDLMKIRNMGPKSLEEIVEKIKPYKEEYEIQHQKKIEETRQGIIDGTISVEELGFSSKIIKALNASGIKSVTEFSNDTSKKVMVKTGLDLLSVNKIIELLNKLDLHEEMPDEIPMEEKKEVEEHSRKLEEPEEQEDQLDMFMQEDKHFEENDLSDLLMFDDEEYTVELATLKMMEEVDEKPVAETEKQSTDLDSVKTKRDELQEMINQLKAQMDQAQSLLDECNEILGENKEDKKPNLED